MAIQNSCDWKWDAFVFGAPIRGAITRSIGEPSMSTQRRASSNCRRLWTHFAVLPGRHIPRPACVKIVRSLFLVRLLSRAKLLHRFICDLELSWFLPFEGETFQRPDYAAGVKRHLRRE